MTTAGNISRTTLLSKRILTAHSDAAGEEEYCRIRWQEAVRRCEDELGVEEVQSLQQCDSYRVLLERLKTRCDAQVIDGLLKRMSLSLKILDSLNKTCIHVYQADYIVPGIFWGLTSLLIDVRIFG